MCRCFLRWERDEEKKREETGRNRHADRWVRYVSGDVRHGSGAQCRCCCAQYSGDKEISEYEQSSRVMYCEYKWE